MNRLIFLLFSFLIFSCSNDDDSSTDVTADILQLQSVKVGTTSLLANQENNDTPADKGIVATFNLSIGKGSVEENFILKNEDGQEVNLIFSYLDDDKTISALPEATLLSNTKYTLQIGVLKAVTGEVFPGVTYIFTTIARSFELETIQIDEQDFTSSVRIQNINRNLAISAVFSDPVNTTTSIENFFLLTGKSGLVLLSFELSEDKKTINISSAEFLDPFTEHTFTISTDLKSDKGFIFEGFTKKFYTAVDSTYKFPEISEEALLTLVQEKTFKYFWDFAHPASGMARERNTSGDLVTTGGSGFGIMTILVGIERGFITRQEGVDRIEKIVTFLETADRFHGVWPHWINGNTGKVIPFSTKDNGGDLVETAFMVQGLLTVREYLDSSNPQEAAIATTITQLWEEVEWDWYTKGGEEVLYWHWSPNYGWEMNHKIQGWNESLIVYVLAASSPTHSIDAETYHQGWARNGAMANGREFYDINLPLGPDYGGPLFFSHYSFLGLDPRNLEDQYANYWTQNQNHALIHQQYAIDNPKNYIGYGAAAWGLTASDSHNGYSAHSPTNDLGVITPTAALSSIPYTPELSLEAMKYFYYILGDKLWGTYGFYDAYNPTEDWYASSYLAIDQGPIVIMIENHRTGLLWDLFMENPEVIAGLEKLGFTNY